MTIPPPVEHLSDRQFASIAKLIERQVGIQLPPAKRTMVEGRLRKRVRALGLKSLDDYGRYLFEGEKIDEELHDLIDVVTTNKTDFFREPGHFEFLCQQAIPSLLAQDPHRALKIWSAAASIGAEAYTIAMVMREMIREGARFRFSVLGTDVSGDVLQQARAAIYPVALAEPIPAELRKRYLMESRDAAKQTMRIVPELRQLVQFHHLNLMDARYPFDRDVDVIFCRNVLIYFDKPTQRAVIERLGSHLRPGGYLILGHSESMAGGGDFNLTQIQPTVFQA